MKDKKQYTTPQGTLQWPFLTGKGRDFQGDGKFKLQTKIELAPGAETDAFVRTLEQITEEGLATINQRIQEDNRSGKNKKPVPKKLSLSLPAFSRDDATGVVSASFSVPAVFTSRHGVGYPTVIRFFDAKGALAEGGIIVGGGTLARVSFTVYAWYTPMGCGVRLEPKGVQVIRLQAPGAGGFSSTKSEDYGFSEETGYVFEASDAVKDETPAAADSGSAGEL